MISQKFSLQKQNKTKKKLFGKLNIIKYAWVEIKPARGLVCKQNSQ